MTSIRGLLLGILLVGVVATIAYLFIFRDGSREERTVMQPLPADHFAPVARSTYRPRSIPLLEREPKKILPPGVDPLDVARIVQIRRKDREPLSIVELKDGGVLVERDSTVEGIEVTDFEHQIVDLGVAFTLGFSLGTDAGGRWTIRPAGTVSLVEILGAVRFPSLGADPDGFGPLIQARVLDEIWVGIGPYWRFADLNQKSLRITIQYTL